MTINPGRLKMFFRCRSLWKWLAWTGLGVLLLFCGVETFLRLRYGLCDAVLMRADDDYEYIAQPSQNRRRFGNRIIYNSHSMRNEELRLGSIRLLCLGDSILNGGTLTDHDALATTILEQKLSHELAQDVQVLNVSAGSWGPDNCLAWVKRHGDFGADGIILVVSSHDVHDTMTFTPCVGRLKYYPVRQYPLAILELWDRYLYPRSTIFHLTKADLDTQFRREHHIEATSVTFNPGFHGLLEYARARKLPFAIYLHATLTEWNNGAYDKDGQAIIQFCRDYQIPLIMDLGMGLTPACFREHDAIHYSPNGQRLMADLLHSFCLEALQHAGQPAK